MDEGQCHRALERQGCSCFPSFSFAGVFPELLQSVRPLFPLEDLALCLALLAPNPGAASGTRKASYSDLVKQLR